jgi:hypothetical protein
LAHVFGTTRACRDGLLKAGRIGEWLYDSFAQMCVTGTVSFNPAPPTITDGQMTFRAVDATYVDRSFGKLRDLIVNNFTKMLHEAVGQIAVF